MEVALYGKGLDLTDALRGYVQQRLDKLNRFLGPAIAPAQVVLSVQRERQTIEVTVPFEGMLLRAEESASSLYAAVDLVVDKLERQIRKYKTRAHKRVRAGGVRTEPAAGREAAADDLLRVKRFTLKPMTYEEAVLQMSLLGHDFFVFREASTMDVQVLYRRREGGYGLIVPE